MTSGKPKFAMPHRTEADLEICYCGDYRWQHKEGKGACSLNGLGHPLGPCMAFRPSGISASHAPCD
jgi:hypothetical protein